jgi:hypothetical protein
MQEPTQEPSNPEALEDQSLGTKLSKILALGFSRIMHDKILLGLVVVGMLGIFVGGIGLGGRDDSHEDAKPKVEATAIDSSNNSQPIAAVTSTNEQSLEPTLAAEFIKWWSGGAMDYSPSSAESNHKAAFRWMTAEAAKAFQNSFWTPEIASGVANGHVVAAFQPISIQPEAVNPDGSVVVGLTGTLVLQTTGQPVTQQVATDFLVRKEKDGLRVAGLYNRAVAYPASTL